MRLFLETHELGARDADAFVRAQAKPCPGRRCVEHWVSEDGRTVEFLVEAPDWETLASASEANDICELFAPVKRWTASDPLYPA